MSLRLTLRHHFALPGKLKSTVWAGPDTRARGEVRTWPSHSNILEEKILPIFLSSCYLYKSTAHALGFCPYPLGTAMPTGANRGLGTAENVSEFLICNQIGKKTLLKRLPHCIKTFNFS